METMPTARSPSTTGRWRKPPSNIICTASTGSVVSVTVCGSAVIHSDACLARVHAAGDRPSEVALGDDSEQAAVRGVGDDDRAHRVLNHLLGGVSDRVLGLDRDHVTGHEVAQCLHNASLPRTQVD